MPIRFCGSCASVGESITRCMEVATCGWASPASKGQQPKESHNGCRRHGGMGEPNRIYLSCTSEGTPAKAEGQAMRSAEQRRPTQPRAHLRSGGQRVASAAENMPGAGARLAHTLYLSMTSVSLPSWSRGASPCAAEMVHLLWRARLPSCWWTPAGGAAGVTRLRGGGSWRSGPANRVVKGPSTDCSRPFQVVRERSGCEVAGTKHTPASAMSSRRCGRHRRGAEGRHAVSKDARAVDIWSWPRGPSAWAGGDSACERSGCEAVSSSRPGGDVGSQFTGAECRVCLRRAARCIASVESPLEWRGVVDTRRGRPCGAGGDTRGGAGFQQPPFE